MVCTDDGGDAEEEVISFLEDYAALARRGAIGPAALRLRLRKMGISTPRIAACTTRADLLELLLFADLPRPYSWRDECIGLLFIIITLMWIAPHQ